MRERQRERKRDAAAAEERYLRFQELRTLDRSPQYNLTKEERKEYNKLSPLFRLHS